MGKRSKPIKPRVVPDDLEAVVREALSATPGFSATQIKNALPRSYQPFAKEAAVLLGELADRKEVYRFRKGKTDLLFQRDPIATLDAALGNRLPEMPIEKDALKQLVNEVAPGHGVVFAEWLKQALARGMLFEHASSSSKAKRYATRPDVRKSLGPVLTALRKALSKTDAQGISKAQVAAVLLGELGLAGPLPAGVNGPKLPTNGAAAASLRSGFLSALRELAAETPREALLAVRELRARLGFTKEQFDSLAIELMREGAISLHHHDHPASLPESERSELVQDARGTYYIGIALRRGE
jgi:hypothetical protein